MRIQFRRGIIFDSLVKETVAESAVIQTLFLSQRSMTLLTQVCF